mmetsp:Transcript_34514/g.80693  ORF Transcript_34514/g.80693 Transcript_34514/m.80693 type:complete len:150 (+) Transcript_34514:659-1108(+)
MVTFPEHRTSSQTDPSHVEWLDDSSCNVVFADIHTARRALHAMGRPVKQAQTAMDAEQLAAMARGEAAQVVLQANAVTEEDDLGWWSGRDFNKQGLNLPSALLTHFSVTAMQCVCQIRIQLGRQTGETQKECVPVAGGSRSCTGQVCQS